MNIMPMKSGKPLIFLLLTLFAWHPTLWSQWSVHESVLSSHTWFKIGVTEDGVYALDHATLSSMGVNTNALNPHHIRLYGNPPGMLPEANKDARIDDLAEIAVQLIGGEDGSFDENDRILFYGHGPVTMTLNNTDYYDYERNSYSDTTFYFLCVDFEGEGLRIGEQPSADLSENSAEVNIFLDYVYHESEEISPYASGRTWYGDMITKADGFKEFVIEIPNIVKSKVLKMRSEVLGRCSSRFPYSLRINSSLLVNQYFIKEYDEHVYGYTHFVDKMFFTDTDRLPVRFELGTTTANPLLFIDYFVINCWRELRYLNQNMSFRVIPSQMETPVVKVSLSDINANVLCWEVTDPLRPVIQQVVYQNYIGFFGLSGTQERRFHLFEMSKVKEVAVGHAIANQNLHGINTADYLIITPRAFWHPAEELAEFHRAEGLDCLLVDVNEIYNEFGTGMPDPTSVRDFIRMVYLRSEKKLKYVLLMGKGTHDYRNIKGMNNNFVPTFEASETPYLEVNSFCTDDYFALMDALEGAGSEGKVDLGVGRLSITTAEQGDQIVAKIKHYTDLSACHGEWKNEHLFMVDNDTRTYVDYVEVLDKVLDTAWHLTTTKKLYLDSYPVVSTASGTSVPQAHEALMDYFKRGFHVMSYTGHGGIKGLTDEKVFTVSDITNMKNYDHLPFIHTATCEFSQFDNPSVVSAGELMMLHPEGGAIGMLTTVRPTLGHHNQQLSKSLHEHFYDLQDGQPLRLGDIYQRVKSDTRYYLKNNVVFVLFGDPALRLSYPSQRIQVTKINGVDLSNEISVMASSLLHVEGVVQDLGGQLDSQFNGVMNVKLFDKKSTHTTLGNYSMPRVYSFYEDLLYDGKVSVEEGRFTMECFIPSSVSFEVGNCRLSYYAYDSIRNVEANGVCDDFFILYGSSSLVDNQGPDIQLYWNTPEFQSGDVVTRNGVLYADLFDEHGIDHYNVSIGRNIVMRSSLHDFDNLILDDEFEPVIDDYQRGRIALPISNLSNGTHEFTLKAWDTQDSSSEVTVTLVVKEGSMLTAAYNYPNPFSSSTLFVLAHDDLTEELLVKIEVFDLMGRLVATIVKQTSSEGGVVPPIEWNGTTMQGNRLDSGVYVYRMTVVDEAGASQSVTNRIIVQ